MLITDGLGSQYLLVTEGFGDDFLEISRYPIGDRIVRALRVGVPRMAVTKLSDRGRMLKEISV